MKQRLKFLIAGLTTSVCTMAQQADLSKMSPMLVDRLVETAAASRGAGSAAEEYVLSLVKLTDGDEQSLTQRGCTVIDRVGNICIALLPVSQLSGLSADDRVVRMEANPLSRALLDVTPAAVNADLAATGWQLPQAYTGKGVVVGICDVGFDYTNPMFRDAAGQTRIRQAWDIYTGGNTGYKGIGTLYTTPAELAAAKGSCDSLQRYHGTHVTAIAAGRAVSEDHYQGIAPESDLVCSLTFLNGYTDSQRKNLINSLNATLKDGTADPLISDVAKGRINLSSAMEVLALKHVMDYATEHGQPCVVNCSFGGQQRLTQDYTLQEELMNSLTGPGRIVVCSAGNNGDGILYQVKDAGQKMDSRIWLYSSLEPVVTLRSSGDFVLKLMPDIAGADTLVVSSAQLRLTMGKAHKDSVYINGPQVNEWMYTSSTAYDVFPGTTSYSVQILLPSNTKAYKTPSVAFVIEGDAEVEVMGMFAGATFNRLRKGSYVDNAPYTVGVPALFSEMIAVGLTSHRDSITNMNQQRVTHEYNNHPMGQVVSWSGSGPTLDGRMKPDIVAPGQNIISAMNSHYALSGLSEKKMGLLADSRTIDGTVYYWKAESGSSMAAPVVTGIVALWLQANPKLTPADVKQILAETATHPETDKTYPNYSYGYGEIDAYMGLLYLAELTGIDGLSDHQPQQLGFRLTGRRLTLEGAHRAAVTVYAVGGQQVLRTLTTDGTVDLSSLRPGVYAVQVDSGEAPTTGSTLVRLQ